MGFLEAETRIRDLGHFATDEATQRMKVAWASE